MIRRFLPFWRVLLLCALGLALAGGCTTPDFGFVDDKPDASGAGTTASAGSAGSAGSTMPDAALAMPTSCSSDADCSALPATRVCDAGGSGQCVECLADTGSDAGAPTCGDGLRCNGAKRCELGCNADADCRNGLACDVASGYCVGCSVDADCSPGTSCNNAVCAPGCAGDSTCPPGWQCCAGACANPLTDANNCSACDTSCGANDCINGACGTGTCPPDFADCDANPQNGCEADLRLDPTNCGQCRVDCGVASCSGGRCTSVKCQAGLADCDQKPDNGCEVSLNDVANCGMCGAACGTQHGTAACPDGRCSISCDKGFADCDQRVATGCETAIDANVKSCGDCDTSCKNDNGKTDCVAGVCQPTCAAGFGDCDLNPVNGCETNVRTSLTDCGACGQLCDLAHASETCDTGVCKVVTCAPGFLDCNGNPADGCEADLSKPETCGSCTNKCSSNGGTPSCVAGACAIQCDAGHENCANGVADGCEADLNFSITNCGKCGTVCPSNGGTPACVNGICGISSCIAPFENCNGGSDGCETNLSNDSSSCGSCGNACYYPNGTGQCINRACTLQACTPVWADCSAAAGCETPLGTNSNCAGCGQACSNAHGSTTCSGSPGSYACSPTCAIGFSDCDKKPENGCEASLFTVIDCGACGVPCAFPNAAASCPSGTCAMGLCTPGFADCTAAPGCETNLGTFSNCGFCGNACTNAHGTTSCGGAPGSYACAPLCATGFKSCDTNLSNGCETNIFTLTDCGGCGVACGFPNAAASCATGTCTMGTCSAGFGDCTAAPGCETNLGTLTNCARCGNACSNAHGTTSCAGAPGSFACAPACAAGFLSCDTNLDNGCETDVTTTTNCGACGNTCSGVRPYCVAGACASPVVNSATNGVLAGAGTLSVNHVLQTPAGRARMVVVLVAGDGNSQASATPTSVIYNGNAMTLGQGVWSGNLAWSGIYYMLDTALPATAGTYPVQVIGAALGKVANVIELVGIDQTPPFVGGGSARASCGTSGTGLGPPSDSIATTVARELILTTAALFTTTTATPGSGQTQTFTGTDGMLRFVGGYFGPTGVGSHAIGWNNTLCNDSAQALMALKPAAP